MAGSNQTEETSQVVQAIPLVFLVRYKPAAMAPAAGNAAALGDSLAGKVTGAVGKMEQVVASIPGLNMFITEEKNETKSELAYNYYDDYSAWDKMIDKIKSGLQDIPGIVGDKAVIEKFEFDGNNEADRERDGKKLFSLIGEKLNAVKGYTAEVHFIGLGQGGNVINECTKKLAADSVFKSEKKWSVKTIVYLATPAYSKAHKLDNGACKGGANITRFYSQYDLTQSVTECFEDNEKLLTSIKDSNKNLLSVAVGKVKLRLVKILTIVMKNLGVDINKDNSGILDAPKQILEEIKGAAEDIVGFMKALINEGTAYVSLEGIPEFKKIVDGYDAIPGKVQDRGEKSFDDLKNALKPKKDASGSAGTGVSAGPQDLFNFVNALCPVFDAISESLAVLQPKPHEEGSMSTEIVKQVLTAAGIKKVLSPESSAGTVLYVDKDFIAKAQQAAIAGEPDMSTVLISRARTCIQKATKNGHSTVAAGSSKGNTDFTSEEEAYIAEAVTCLTLPMLPTKMDFYKKLVKLIPDSWDLEKLLSENSATSLLGKVDNKTGNMGKLSVHIPEDLKASVAKVDAEAKRIAGYFNKNNFKLADKADALYLIYNSHNLVLRQTYGQIQEIIDKQTGYMNYMKAKGYDSTVAETEVTYKQGSSEKEDAVPTRHVEQEKAA